MFVFDDQDMIMTLFLSSLHLTFMFTFLHVWEQSSLKDERKSLSSFGKYHHFKRESKYKNDSCLFIIRFLVSWVLFAELSSHKTRLYG